MVQESACLYNWQHEDYDNLFKDNCSKEIAAGTRAKGKEQAAQYVVHLTKAHWCQGKAPLILQKAVRVRECTSGQAAKWRYEEQMRFFRFAFRKER